MPLRRDYSFSFRNRRCSLNAVYNCAILTELLETTRLFVNWVLWQKARICLRVIRVPFLLLQACQLRSSPDQPETIENFSQNFLSLFMPR